MERIFWYFVIVFSLVSCYEITEKPKNILDKTTISEVLYHIYLQKNYLISVEENNYVQNYEVKKFVLKKMKISESLFDVSMDYYVLHPTDHKEILEDVKVKFEAEKLKKTKKTKTTSIPTKNND